MASSAPSTNATTSIAATVAQVVRSSLIDRLCVSNRLNRPNMLSWKRSKLSLAKCKRAMLQT
jgi:hypothetical protein